MQQQGITTLMAKLLDKTRLRRVDWESTASVAEYVTQLGTYALSISMKKYGLVGNQIQPPDYSLKILNEGGEAIATITETRPHQSYYDALQETYEIASLVASGLEAGLKALIEGLDSL